MLCVDNNKLMFYTVAVYGLALLLVQGDSPRISSEFSTSTITIQSSNDPFGVFSIQSEGSGRVSEPSSVTLIVSRKGGTFGQVGIRVRTVGGGERWDDLIDLTSESGNLDTIGEVLSVQNQSRQAVAGQDYQQLDTLLQFEEGATRSSVILYITDDTVPEDDENIFVYIQSQTKGARIAQPSTDAGLKGYAEIVIERNDYWNGWIGFYPLNSSKVSVDEDTGEPLVLTVERRNSSLQELKLHWRALVSSDDKAVYSSRIDLPQQLVSTTGSITCQHGRRFCNFYVLINDDQIPENSTWFLVEIYFNPLVVDQGARIDPAHRFANVTILPSDNPNGMIQFDDNSRFVFVDTQQDAIPLHIRRLGYSGKQVTVSYQTVQIEGPTTFGGTEVYAALEGADYDKNEGTLIFEPRQVEKTVVLKRDHLRASDNPYPKLFRVELSDISRNAELGFAVSSIVITKQTEHEVWKLWAEGQTDQSNSTIDNLMTKLTIAVQNRDLSVSQLKVIMDIIDRVLDVAMNKAPLSAGVHTNMMRVMCSLLDPQRNDATRGQWQLSQRMDRFALSYVAHLKCDTCCQPKFTESPACDHLRFVVAKRYPEDINGYRWNTRNNDVLIVADGMLRVLDHGKMSATPRCYPVVMMDYSSDLWFTTHRTQNTFLSHKIISLKIKDEPSRILNQPINFRVHTPGQGTPDKKSECVYFDEVIQQWMSSTQYGKQVCSVKNNLIMALDNYVDCACSHLSLYAVKSDPRNPDMIGYPIWFHISCFISMAGLAFAILAHHVCIYSRFSASLLMHMCFAVLAAEVCYVIDAYLSPFHLLNIGSEDNNSKCVVMSLFFHYFFVAQFTWMMVQAINYFKILVLNDEHTERKYVMYFLLGWGLPVILVAAFYIVTYLVYRFLTNLPPDKIYGDVTSAGDICFVTNPVAGLAGILAPCLIFLMVVGIVFIQAYQMSPQWQSYDDIYKGRHNIHEVRFILLLFAFIALMWLWGGLHMAYGQLWMLVLFCAFNIIMGLYVFVVYTLLRLPCASCTGQQKVVYAINDTQAIQKDSGYQTQDRPHLTDSVKGSPLIMMEEPWERESLEVSNEVLHTNNTLRVKRTAPNTNVYVLPAAGYNMKPPSFDRHESQDLNDLILALRAGEVVTSSESLDPLDRHDITTDGSTASRVEHKRISIADTHL